VKALLIVPATVETVTTSALPAPAELLPTIHVTCESVVQEVVAQSTSSNAVVGVYELTPKLKPRIVTVDPPDVGAFENSPAVTTGASYEKSDMRVPTTALTVTIAVTLVPTFAATWHMSAVLEFHDDVAQSTLPRLVDGVGSAR
jgi:hypothetical protein